MRPILCAALLTAAGCSSLLGFDEDYTLGGAAGSTGAAGAGGEAPTGTGSTSTTSGGGGDDPTCTDGERNGDESDVDCGGACEGCDLQELCIKDTDCELANCVDETCICPPGKLGSTCACDEGFISCSDDPTSSCIPAVALAPTHLDTGSDITFERAMIASLPDHVGIVWNDSDPLTTHFAVFTPEGETADGFDEVQPVDIQLGGRAVAIMSDKEETFLVASLEDTQPQQLAFFLHHDYYVAGQVNEPVSSRDVSFDLGTLPMVALASDDHSPQDVVVALPQGGALDVHFISAQRPSAGVESISGDVDAFGIARSGSLTAVATQVDSEVRLRRFNTGSGMPQLLGDEDELVDLLDLRDAHPEWGLHVAVLDSRYVVGATIGDEAVVVVLDAEGEPLATHRIGKNGEVVGLRHLAAAGGRVYALYEVVLGGGETVEWRVASLGPDRFEGIAPLLPPVPTPATATFAIVAVAEPVPGGVDVLLHTMGTDNPDNPARGFYLARIATCN